MCTQQNVWNNCFGDQVGSRRYAVIDMRANITIGPSIKPTFSDVRKKVGGNIIVEVVAFVYRGPQEAGLWIEPNAGRISQAAGIDPHVLPVRVHSQNCSSAGIRFA